MYPRWADRSKLVVTVSRLVGCESKVFVFVSRMSGWVKSRSIKRGRVERVAVNHLLSFSFQLIRNKYPVFIGIESAFGTTGAAGEKVQSTTSY